VVTRQEPNGFTLLESIVALAVASIALLALLQLQLLSIRAAGKAEWTSRAVLLAREKLAEVLSTGYPSVGLQSGMVETDGGPLAWRIEVTEARSPLSYRRSSGQYRMRRLSVEVTGPAKSSDAHISMTTYVAENTIRGA
jgi:general secretion pathway protein I